MLKLTTTNIFAALTLILLIIELRLLDYLFPYTGMGAIIFVPLIYIICIGIIWFGIKLSNSVDFKLQLLTWTSIIILNTIIAINMYAQDSRPSVTEQIQYTYSVIRHFETISEADLKLSELDNFDRRDCRIKDSRERYVSALYKYQDKIPRDGSYLLFNKDYKPLLKNTDIKSKLETGQDELIWWLLEK